MFLLYDLIATFILIFYLPIYLFKRKFHKGFLERFGFIPKGLVFDRPIWIHAVSVGEAMAIKVFVAELKKKFPQKQLVISTVTPTGNKIARRLAGKNDCVIYLPIDISFVLRRVIDKIKPSVFILAETELWPNIITYLKGKNVPVLVVNGRISDASFRGYMAVRLLTKPILNAVSLFCVQSERDAKRLKHLGVADDKIKVVGNMKFDIQGYADSAKDCTDYREKLGLSVGDRLWVAGSTHSGEEETVLSSYKE
jgi:3-deoxy-D-manno-octulosonic-acid transferase